MSYTVTVKANFTNQKAIERLATLDFVRAIHHSENVTTLYLKSFYGPVRISAEGDLTYDADMNRGRRMRELNQLKQYYQVFVAQDLAEQNGWGVQVEEQPDGSILVVME